MNKGAIDEIKSFEIPNPFKAAIYMISKSVRTTRI